MSYTSSRTKKYTTMASRCQGQVGSIIIHLCDSQEDKISYIRDAGKQRTHLLHVRVQTLLPQRVLLLQLTQHLVQAAGGRADGRAIADGPGAGQLRVDARAQRGRRLDAARHRRRLGRRRGLRGCGGGTCQNSFQILINLCYHCTPFLPRDKVCLVGSTPDFIQVHVMENLMLENLVTQEKCQKYMRFEGSRSLLGGMPQ